MNVIAPVDGTNNIRYADFIRMNVNGVSYRFTTAPSNMTVAAVDASPFDSVGVLMKVGDVQRDIKSTANETTLSLTGIDTATLGFILGQNIKGSPIEMWHGFFNTDGELLTTGGTGGLYKFFTGIITAFSINENWMEEAKMYVGTITVSASAIQLILQNRISGRYTNDNSWQFNDSGDTSMNRVAFIETINYAFGKDAPANS
ncbi:hypothetical protein UFOVP924_42 [uncultured Caudovirales phage]|uniref:Uncharacterized protein n=1 Tax=uncultured Caudovirales phage TaxID=2100421 RepID=A0A6J5PJT8_9CAUD|nr:hypothetical protein UFOVP924_42 [uncultured Caudovirales phage]CAB4199821.1 hypothetical protein UFOVP1348_13 [uncultured Caudovirales phage]